MKKLSFLLAWLMTLVFLPSRSFAQSTTLYGCVSSSSSDERAEPGIYSFTTSAPTNFTSVKTGVKVYGGGTIVGDMYYAISYTELSDGMIHLPIPLTVYNTKTWEVEKEYQGNYSEGLYQTIAKDLTYDHITKRVYGCFYDPADYYAPALYLGYLTFNDEMNSYNTHIIGKMAEQMVAITIDKGGNIYTLGESGKLYTANKLTGESTLIGDTKIGKQFFFRSMAYDFASDKIYYAGNNPDGNNALFEIHPKTAATTQLADYYNDTWDGSDDQIVGLYVDQEVPDVTIPAAVDDLAINFQGTLRTGEITFTMPSTYETGEPLTGRVRYEISLNYEPIKTGEADAGKTIKELITVPDNGQYTFSVTTTVNEYPSTAATVSQYIGFDTPLPPTEVLLEASEENADGSYDLTLTWKAPTAGVHNAYVNKENITYTITRMPDNVEVAKAHKGTTFTDKITPDVRTTYHYEITATADKMTSEKAVSNGVTVKNIVGCPFVENFDDEANVALFTIVDANRDGSTWFWANGSMAYEFNAKNAANDYIMTPGILMTLGKVYTIEFTVANSFPVERIAVYAGNAKTAAAMTTEVVAPTNIGPDKQVVTLRGSFTPEKDGLFYFGIKAMSDKDMSTMYIDDLSIEESSASKPAAVTDFSVIAGPKGANYATISFATPTLAMDGTSIKVMDIQIVRDDNLVKEFKDVPAGEMCSYKDENLAEGLYTYKVWGKNENGIGEIVENKVYVGIDIPGKVMNLKATEDINNEGTIILTWEAPAVGQNGGYVDPAGLTYYVLKGSTGTEGINNGNATTFTDPLPVNDKLIYEGYNVWAENDRGSGRNVWQTIIGVAGPAVVAPMIESIEGMKMKSGPWITEQVVGEIGDSYWNPVDGTLQKSGSQDNDGGLWVFTTTALKKSTRLISPKVTISHLAKPEVSFWVYNTGKADKVDVYVSKDYEDYISLGTITVAGEKGWVRHSFDLTPYKDAKAVRVAFVGTAVEGMGEIIAFDNVAVAEGTDCNLQMVSIETPEKIYVGQAAVFTATIRNSGSKALTAEQYSINLMKNGELAASVPGEEIRQGEKMTFNLEDIPAINDKEMNEYYVAIDCAEDAYMADNESEKVTIELVFNTYPVPTYLSASGSTGTIRLRWAAPDLTKPVFDPEVDSFEDYEAFAIDGYGDWTVVDVDDQPTILITLGEGLGNLEYPHAGDPMAFQVFNSNEAGIPFSSWTPHTGDQMLVAFKCTSPDQGATEITNDDWLISPLLNGKAQTISFYAKTGMTSYYQPERFEVWYSTTGTDIADFKQIGKTVDLYNVNEWDEFKYDLPEGAKHFAIRCVSEAKFALLIDDISYLPAEAEPVALTLKGYNIYRGDVRLNDALLTNTNFTDTDVEENVDYTYYVTAVYDKGESRFSKPCIGNTTVVANEQVQENTIDIEVIQGGIRISGAEGLPVRVLTTIGATVYADKATEPTLVSLQTGVYLIAVGNQTTKVVIP